VGDPCGVGPEVVLKALAVDLATAAARLLVVGDEANLRQTARQLKLRWPFGAVVRDPPEDLVWDRPLLLDLANVDPALLPGQISGPAGRAAVEAIEKSVELCLTGRLDGMVTAPIHKEALSLAGYADPGHTEMLARLTRTPRVAMLFWTEDFSVALLSTHMSLAHAIRKVRRRSVLQHLVFVEKEWRRLMGQTPRIVVAGLNPHSSEGGRFGLEEAHHIAPAIEAARAKGLSVDGPAPPDSVFQMARDGRYDLVLALYHDQGTIPVKFGYGRRAVNITLGLPFVRTSVDHGTAMDIAGKGVASEESLVQAILLAARLVQSRRTSGKRGASRR
jgi:4-hydroxythreonine-4-phosphate dehydrogenase